MKTPSLSSHFTESQDAQVIGPNFTGTNEITNPFLDADNAYPTGNGYIASTAGMPSGWVIYNPMYLDASTSNYTVHSPTLFLENHKPFKDTELSAPIQKRVLKLYGGGTSFQSRNQDTDRDYPNPPVACNVSDGTTINYLTPSGRPDVWVRTDFGQRSITVPDSATTATMKVYVRVPKDDKFRELNFGGGYLFSTNFNTQTSQTYGTVSYFAVKNSSHNLALEDNPTSGAQSHYNWCGFSHSGTGEFVTRWIDNPTISGAYYNSEDYEQFKPITVTMTLPSGTGRNIGFALYFAENHSYLPLTPPDPNPPTGSIEFYQPHLSFS
jgi:hypothetical protein